MDDNLMSNINEQTYLRKYFPDISGMKVLEVGSKLDNQMSQGGHEMLMTLFQSTYKDQKYDYVGTDIEEGNNVDIALDLTESDSADRIIEKFGQFDFVNFSNVLEHTPVPWLMVEQISKLVKQEGMLFISSPWVHRYHRYPDDYYRYSHRAIEYLFPYFQWENLCYSGNNKGTLYPIMDRKKMSYSDQGKALRTNDTRKYMAQSAIMMIGQKKETKVKQWMHKPENVNKPFFTR
jgi:SAM-dependent methyltransferase